MCLNGIGLTSGNTFTAVASVVVTFAAYRYRIRVEDAMLASAFGDSYEEYRRSVGALVPWAVREILWRRPDGKPRTPTNAQGGLP